jgi:hypothetical protein
MKWKSVLCLALIWSGSALGQSVTLPPEVKGGVGAWIIIAPEKIDGGKPRWRIDPGLQEVRLDLLLPPEQIAMLRGKVVTANKAGRFKIEAWNAKADAASDISTCWVVIGEPVPVPPDPKPPNPNPEPSADNPFVFAWKMETVANKENIVAVIAALYRGYASEAKAGTKTGKQLFDFMSAAYLAAKSGDEPIAGKLTKLVPVVNQWIASTLKIPEGQLTAEERAATHATFSKIANWLGELR